MLLLVKNHSTSRRSTAAMVIPESCPACGSTRYKKNGHTRHGKQNHLCKNCERQFSAGADNLLISPERRAGIANLLRERLSLRGICRAVGVSLTWLLHFMVECFASCPDHLHARLPTRPAKVWVYKLEADAVSVNLLYGFGRFNLQNPGYPPAHFSWCEPCISHRVVRYQPHAIATMAGGFYAHGSAPLAAARSFSPGPRCVPAGFSPLGYATPRSPGAVHPHPEEPRDRHPL